MTRCNQKYSVHRQPLERGFSKSSTRLIAIAGPIAIAQIFLAGAVFAAADECGGLKVPGYAGKRKIGEEFYKVMVSPDRERVEHIGDPVHIEIVDLQLRAPIYMLVPDKKTALIPPAQAKPPPPAQMKGAEKYTDKVPAADGSVKITLGVSTDNGKEWLVETTCRPDGIWTDRKIKTPKGVLTFSQSDIRIEAIPAAQFEPPADYKIVKQGK
jgi:hypothetical protein